MWLRRLDRLCGLVSGGSSWSLAELTALFLRGRQISRLFFLDEARNRYGTVSYGELKQSAMQSNFIWRGYRVALVSSAKGGAPLSLALVVSTLCPRGYGVGGALSQIFFLGEARSQLFHKKTIQFLK